MSIFALRLLALLIPTAPALAQGSVTAPPIAVSSRPLVYVTPFAGYQSFKEQPIGSWREAVDTVGRIGGWQSYAREAQGQSLQPITPSIPAPATGQHGGHR